MRCGTGMELDSVGRRKGWKQVKQEGDAGNVLSGDICPNTERERVRSLCVYRGLWQCSNCISRLHLDPDGLQFIPVLIDIICKNLHLLFKRRKYTIADGEATGGERCGDSIRYRCWNIDMYLSTTCTLQSWPLMQSVGHFHSHEELQMQLQQSDLIALLLHFRWYVESVSWEKDHSLMYVLVLHQTVMTVSWQ